MKFNLRDISKFHADRLKGRAELRKNTIESYEPADLLDHYLAQIEKEQKLGTDASTIFPDTEPGQYLKFFSNTIYV